MDSNTLEIHQFSCVSPLEVPLDENGKFNPNGKPTKLEKFAVGNLSGIDMAIQDLKTQGFDFFRTSDYVTFECTEIQPALKFGNSDMPLFTVSITDRPPQQRAAV